MIHKTRSSLGIASLAAVLVAASGLAAADADLDQKMLRK
jgi:hypothetical protein